MKYALWLSNIPGIGNGKIRFLLGEDRCARDVYGMSEAQLKNVYGLTKEDVLEIQKSRAEWNLEAEWNRLAQQGIGFVSAEQEDYPQKLRRISNPPYSLYYKGRLPCPGEKAAAIVGARCRSAYGSETAHALALELAKRGVAVISGLARGIDADGHRGALDAGGATFAVLGCGVNVCYPKGNRYLYDRIPQRGGLISEFPPDLQPQARLFPVRNRLISAFSDCVIVIEAREKSGSLITADFALEQGKDVYALPGRVTDELSRGCNRLIRQGAGIFLGVEDFLKEWELLCGGGGIQMDFSKNLLEKDERLVYSLLDFCPAGIGTLLDKTPFSLTELLDILSRLEGKGMIREQIPNYYVKTLNG